VTNNVCNGGHCELNTSVSCSTNSQCTSELFEYSKYNAIGVIGNENNNGDGVLCLGGGASAGCPNGAEYNACPQTWILSQFAEGGEDPFLGGGSSVSTEVTFVPCTENFESQVPSSVTVQFQAINEFEQQFSASTTITCWANLTLSKINQIFN